MEFESSVLDSGLRVVTAKLPGRRMAAFSAFVNCGARDEYAPDNGVAHFLEHMAFKGTTTRSSLQIAAEVESLGADINAYTSHETTAYYVVGLREHADNALSIIGDVLTDSIHEESDIAVERDVILQEIKRSHDNPGNVAWNGFMPTAYPDHPLGRSILGPSEIVGAMSRDQITSFVRRNYMASNMVVAGAGDIDHAAFRDLVAAKFARLPTTQPVSERTTPAYAGGVNIDRSRPFEQVTILLGYPTVSETDPKSAAHSIFAEAFGGGMSSPLFQEIREKRGLVYAVRASSFLASDNGLFIVSAGTTAEKVDEFFRVTRDEIAKAAAGLTEADFRRAKNSVLVQIETAMEKPFTLAEGAASDLFTRGRIRSADEVRAEVEGITIESVRAAASEMLAATPVISMVGPVPEADYMAMLR